MAQIDIANLDDLKVKHANVSNIVGAGAINEKNDVLMIQALFLLCGDDEGSAKRFFGISKKKLPSLTGVFNRKTHRAIWSFQRMNSNRLLSVDGLIHPASYQNRVLRKIEKGRLMTITYLNLMALEVGILSDFSGDMETDIKSLAPSIIFKQPGFLEQQN